MWNQQGPLCGLQGPQQLRNTLISLKCNLIGGGGGWNVVYSHNSHNLCCFCAGNSAGQCIDYVASSGLNNIPHHCVFTVSTLPPCVCTATVIPLKQPGWDPKCFGASPRYVFFLRNPSVIGSSESSTAICVLAHLSIDLNVKICAKTHQDLL